MAMYETVIQVARPVATTFAFVSDFSNAEEWDPRTYAAERVTEEPIGVGTRFVLTGGVLRESTLQRLRIPVARAGMALPYDVVAFDPPNSFVLEGETSQYRYDDHLDFSPSGGGTALRYRASLELKGALAIADRLLQAVFTRIGDDATRDLAATVEAGTAA